MKFKELIKTIILTGLVISSLVLSAKIWFSKELWPDGYNSFHYARKSNVFSGIFSVFNPDKTKALELDSKMRQSASLLAIIYALDENKAEAEKYFHLAITCGEKPDDLKNAIEMFRKAADTEEQ